MAGMGSLIKKFYTPYGLLHSSTLTFYIEYIVILSRDSYSFYYIVI